MSATLLFATGNPGKLAELRALLGASVAVKSLADYPELPPVEEDAESFEGNAEKKAAALAQATGLPALADDSGLCVDGLGGAPGVRSARWAPGSDADRVNALLERLRGGGGEGRRAHFACALTLALPDGRTFTEVGRCWGEIARAPRGSGGFGYDPVFLPSEYAREGKAMAELSREEKGAISHRGKALRALLPTLKRELGL